MNAAYGLNVKSEKLISLEDEALFLEEYVLKEYGAPLPNLITVDNQSNPIAIVKYTNGKWSWYVMGGDKLQNNDYRFLCLVDGWSLEGGHVPLKQILGAGAEIDPNFTPTSWDDLKAQLRK